MFKGRGVTTKQACDCKVPWRGTSDEVLRAPNPFDPADELWGCPKCKAVECLYLVCDEPGCWEHSTCGTPTPAGYRSTCGKHMPKDR